MTVRVIVGRDEEGSVTATEVFDAGESFQIGPNGHLLVSTAKAPQHGRSIAVFAPGAWISAVVGE